MSDVIRNYIQSIIHNVSVLQDIRLEAMDEYLKTVVTNSLHEVDDALDTLIEMLTEVEA